MVNIYCYVFCWSFSKRPNLVNPNPGVTAIYNFSNIYIEYICNKLSHYKNYFSIVSVNFTESWNTLSSCYSQTMQYAKVIELLYLDKFY